MTQETLASGLIDRFGGVTELSRLIGAPVSTVHSWRKLGIPPARLSHIALVAKVAKKPITDADEIAAEWDRLSAERKALSQDAAA